MKYKLVWVRKLYSFSSFNEVKKLHVCGHKIHLQNGFWFVEVLTDAQTADAIMQSNKRVRLQLQSEQRYAKVNMGYSR